MPKKPGSPTENLPIPIEIIERRIYLIRSHKVMLDSDLADLYEVTTGNLNLAVKRNKTRFPGDFMFKLTKEAADRLYNRRKVILRSRFAPSKNYMQYTCKHCQAALDNSPEQSEGDWFIRCFSCGAKNVVRTVLEVVGWRV